MKVFDVIKYEGGNDILVWKFPGEDFNTLSQLIVHESQEALFFKDGKALDLFRAGRYTLHSQNIPLIRRVVNLPFNGESPFHCEVYFINKVVSMDVKWGTTAMPIQDPIYKIIVPINVYGQFAVQVVDSKKFILEMVGTIKQFDHNTLLTYFRGILLSNIKDYIASQFSERNLSFLEIQGNLKSISDGIENCVTAEFEKYGLRLVNFNVFSIEPSQDDPSYMRLKEALARKAEMNVIGYNYQQERTYDILGTAAANKGTAGNVMGVGLGLGMGANIGNTIGKMMGDTTAHTNIQETTKKSENTIKCPSCHNDIPADAKFCMNCGAEIRKESEKEMVICPHCKERVPKGKFCMSCGKEMENVCPKCGAEILENAKFCMSCGAKIK